MTHGNITHDDYALLEEEYYELLHELSKMKHSMRIMKMCINKMVSDGAKEPYLNGDPLSSHEFWKELT